MSSSTADLPPAELANFAYQKAHINDDDGYKLIIVAIVWGVLTLLATAARVWSRCIQKVGLGFDDWLIIAATGFGILMVTVTCLLPRYGLGRHVLALSPEQDVEIGKTSFAFELVYIPALALAKLSILALYRRIFGKVARWFTISLWALFVYTILWAVGVLLSVLLECQPISSLWTSNCAPQESTTISTGVLNIISDVAIFLLPQPLIWPLQMDVRRKIGVSLVLCLGLFATLISIIRIPIIIQTGTSHVYDLTYNLITTDILTIIEPLTIIICADLPVTRTLWQKITPKSMGLDTLRSMLRRRRQYPSEYELSQPGHNWSEISKPESNGSRTTGSENYHTSASKGFNNYDSSDSRLQTFNANAINVAMRIEVTHDREI